MTGAPPLRFLGAVVGGWICVRAAMLVPEWGAEAEAEPLQPDFPTAIAAAPVLPPSPYPDPIEETLEPVVRRLLIPAPPPRPALMNGEPMRMAALAVGAYAQAGVVGARSRDLFADASVAVALPLDEERRLTVGGGLWGGAQPGISRIDAGPRLSLKLPGAERVRVIADWRFRLDGKAAPASGPSLTLATDF